MIYTIVLLLFLYLFTQRLFYFKLYFKKSNFFTAMTTKFIATCYFFTTMRTSIYII